MKIRKNDILVFVNKENKSYRFKLKYLGKETKSQIKNSGFNRKFFDYKTNGVIWIGDYFLKSKNFRIKNLTTGETWNV